MINVIKYKGIFLGVSGALVALSVAAIAVFGFRPGIDLVGGTSWQIEANASLDRIQSVMKDASGGEASVKTSGDGSFIIRFKDSSEEKHQEYLKALQDSFGEIKEKNFSSIGPTIGSELRRSAIWAIILVLVGISLYVAFAFRKVSEPVRSWKYGLVTLITLFHDVAVPAGLLAVLGKLKGIEIDTNFIVALLVVMGFSVHDTIVVFDRIRENLILFRGRKAALSDIINTSVHETIVRSVNTSLTLVLVLLTLVFFGPAPLFYFVLTILVGTVVGTYSSIFVASPLLYLWQKKQQGA
ncbi:MAG TPA: protein translocase subunit SecF [Candidatus Paceibacterota bacterium]|nr:protein translocase subunit SecF [Candidatus Paceibacterota bacterium]